MQRHSSMVSTAKAFTLIELLVVIGIISVLAGGIGIALRGNNPGASLRSAQGFVLSSLSSARGQAALTQSNARIVVQADNANDNFLRSIRIVIADSAAVGGWRQVGGEILLPEGVYVVPPVGSGLTGITLDATSGPWTTQRQSSLFNTATESLGALRDATKLLTSKPISSLGTIDGGNIIVAAGRKTGVNTIVLDNASAVRGLVVSRYGVASLVNDANSLN